jgi:hypothetical protein
MNQAQVRLPSIIEEGVTTNPELKRSIDYNDRSVKKEKSEILSKNDVSGTKNTRDDTIQYPLNKIKRDGQGGKSRSSRKRSSKSRNLRRKSIKRHRRRTSRK